MSCFQCTPETIATLAAFACHARLSTFATDTIRRGPDATFKLLWDANARSVACRYREPAEPAPDAPTITRREITGANAGALLAVCSMYEYQCCDSPAWGEGDEAYRIIETVRAFAIRAVPGYQDASLSGIVP
jgi:hypothetical protein